MTIVDREAMNGQHNIGLHSCGRTFEIHCHDHETAALVRSVFGGLLASSPPAQWKASKHYDIEHDGTGRFRLVESGGAEATFDGRDSLLFHLDKSITITLQEQRPDLYFLHAAAVALDDRVAALAAPAGTGKSTIALALLANQFAYLSDELTPIEPETLRVHPYPRALCLKAPLPEGYRLPQGTLDTGSRFHVPVDVLGSAGGRPLPLGAIFFLKRQRTQAPVCLSAAEGAAFVMANALNLAAHPSDGLDVAIRLSRTVPCFALDSTDLDAACSAVTAILRQQSRGEKEN
jgi:hypothetical protein